ncbi:MAG: hypothetical protein QMC67_07010 [Candidatus Wallbacteria bacterium]
MKIKSYNKLMMLSVIGMILISNLFSGNNFCLAAPSNKTVKNQKTSLNFDFLKFVPAEYQFVVHIDIQKLIKNDKTSLIKNSLAKIFGARNLSLLKTLDFSFWPVRNDGENFDFMCFTGGKLDYDEIIKTISANADVKIGEHEGYKAFRFYNLAGIYSGDCVILGTTGALKKVISIIKGKETALFYDMAFTTNCRNAYAASENTSPSVTGFLGDAFLKKANSDKEFIYNDVLDNADFLYFTIADKALELIIKNKTENSAEKFVKKIEKELSGSAKETDSALSEFEVLENKSGERKKFKNITAQAAFTRKLLKFADFFNKNARVMSSGTNVTLYVNFDEPFLKKIIDIISSHENSWWIIFENFISSQVTCKEYSIFLENAALIYFNENKNKSKNSVTVDELCEFGVIGKYLKCAGGGIYSISLDPKRKIKVTCSKHSENK